MEREEAIPLTVIMKMAFNSVIESRKSQTSSLPKEKRKEIIDQDELLRSELIEVKNKIALNSHFSISENEIVLLFASWQHKRTHRKPKIKNQQLYLYA